MQKLKKKFGFILFEVCIAIALIMLSIIPIASYPHRLYYLEQKNLQIIELARINDLIFANFLKNRSNYISWKELVNDQEIVCDLGVYVIDLSLMGKFEYNSQLTISLLDETVAALKNDDQLSPSIAHSLLNCRLELIPQSKKRYRARNSR